MTIYFFIFEQSKIKSIKLGSSSQKIKVLGTDQGFFHFFINEDCHLCYRLYNYIIWRILTIFIKCNCFFSLNDHELVWKYVDWVLSKDEENGVRVSQYFINIQYFVSCKEDILSLQFDESILVCAQANSFFIRFLLNLYKSIF